MKKRAYEWTLMAVSFACAVIAAIANDVHWSGKVFTVAAAMFSAYNIGRVHGMDLMAMTRSARR